MSVPPSDTPPAQGPPQGWYQDPHGRGLRWWDGTAWTEHTHAAAPVSPEPQEEEAAPEADAVTIGGEEEPAPTTAAPTAHEATPPGTSTAPPGAGAGGTIPGHGPAAQTPPTRPTSSIPESDGSGLAKYARPLALLAILVVALVAALIVFGGDDGDDGGGSSAEADQIFADNQAMGAARTAQTAVETYSVDNGGSYAGATPEDLAGIEPTLKGAELSLDTQETTYSITVDAPESGNAFTVTRTNDGAMTFSCAEPGRFGCPEGGDWSQPAPGSGGAGAGG